MSANSSFRVAELLCSRLCHDLISPVSAINNGLEFLQGDDPAMFEDALGLVKRSGTQAADRLGYFRVAFGAGSDRESLRVGEIKALAGSFAEEKGLEVLWTGTGAADEAEIGRDMGKLLLNLILFCADCLPRKGTISLEISSKCEKPAISLQLEGDRCQVREDVQPGLSPDISHDDLTVRNVLAHICVQLALIQGMSLKIREHSQHSLIVTVS